MIFPFELSPEMTFPRLIFVMLDNNEVSPVMCLEQTLSNNHFQDEVFGTHTFLGPSCAFFWDPSHITNFVILHRTCINQVTNTFTIITCLVWFI
jgi:hypothetical protein